MKALQNLTEYLKKHVVDAKQFDVWAEDGALFCGQSNSIDGFDLEYTAILFIQNVKIEPHILFLHLVIWLNKCDPYRQEKGLAFPTFATEILDNGHCDIKIKIDLQEEYSLKESENGNWEQQGIRSECVSDFTETVDTDQLNELVYFVGHKEDLPCQS